MKYAECHYCGQRLYIGDNITLFKGHKYCDRDCIKGYISIYIKDFVLRKCDCEFGDDAE